MVFAHYDDHSISHLVCCRTEDASSPTLSRHSSAWQWAPVMMGQLNSANALIRIYSRMIMCTFLVIVSVATFLFSDYAPALVTLCSTIFYTFLFRCYQDKSSPGWIFYAYLAIGLASVFWVQVLFFLPFLWIITSTNLLAMNFRNFIASLLGVIAPLLVLVGVVCFQERHSGFCSPL